MKIKIKIKTRKHRYDKIDLGLDMDTNTRYISKCLSMMILTCIKQHLSNIWSSIHENVKQHWGWVEKSVASKEKRVDYIKEKKRNISII